MVISQQLKTFLALKCFRIEPKFSHIFHIRQKRQVRQAVHHVCMYVGGAKQIYLKSDLLATALLRPGRLLTMYEQWSSKNSSTWSLIVGYVQAAALSTAQLHLIYFYQKCVANRADRVD